MVGDTSAVGAVGSVGVVLGDGPLAVGLVLWEVQFAVCVLGTVMLAGSHQAWWVKGNVLGLPAVFPVVVHGPGGGTLGDGLRAVDVAVAFASGAGVGDGGGVGVGVDDGSDEGLVVVFVAEEEVEDCVGGGAGGEEENGRTHTE